MVPLWRAGKADKPRSDAAVTARSALHRDRPLALTFGGRPLTVHSGHLAHGGSSRLTLLAPAAQQLLPHSIHEVLDLGVSNSAR